MIEYVEELGAKLKVQGFSYSSNFRGREVEFGKAGTYERIAANVTVSAGWGREKSSGIEVLAGRAGIEIAGKGGVPVGADGVAGVAVSGGVIAELGREGEA